MFTVTNPRSDEDKPTSSWRNPAGPRAVWTLYVFSGPFRVEMKIKCHHRAVIAGFSGRQPAPSFLLSSLLYFQQAVPQNNLNRTASSEFITGRNMPESSKHKSDSEWEFQGKCQNSLQIKSQSVFPWSTHITQSSFRSSELLVSHKAGAIAWPLPRTTTRERLINSKKVNP